MSSEGGGGTIKLAVLFFNPIKRNSRNICGKSQFFLKVYKKYKISVGPLKMLHFLGAFVKISLSGKIGKIRLSTRIRKHCFIVSLFYTTVFFVVFFFFFFFLHIVGLLQSLFKQVYWCHFSNIICSVCVFYQILIILTIF